jgi:chemotaxis protein CheD
MKKIVNVADLIVSANADDVLITYALGPCLGVAIADLEAGVGALLHAQLPTAGADSERLRRNPAQFVDSGLVTMLEAMIELGAEPARMSVKVAGGAHVMDDLNIFQIAKRNYAVLKKLLWKNNLLIAAEDVGGNVPRTMSLEVGSGRVVIQSGGQQQELLSKRERPRECVV